MSFKMSDYYIHEGNFHIANFFANIDEHNRVVKVIAINKEKCENLSFPMSEIKGQEYLESLGMPGKWLQTSYTGEFRSSHAEPGGIYDPESNRFIPKQPYTSWVYDEQNNTWVAPVPRPDDGDTYYWDEESQNWYSDYEVE